MHHVRPFGGYPGFAVATEDVTYDMAFSHAIGLSAADVTDLSHVLLGADFNVSRAVRLLDMPDAVLCTGDVLDVLRAVHAQRIPETPRAVRWISMLPGLYLDDYDDTPGLTSSDSHGVALRNRQAKSPSTSPTSILTKLSNDVVVT